MEYRPSRTERTRVALGEAVIALLREMPLERITADDIADRAGMGRATWFRHFSRKEDAVVCVLVDRWRRWADATGLDPSTRLALKSFLEQTFEQRETISLLYRAGLRSTIVEASAQVAEVLRGEGDRPRYQEKFLLYGYVGVIDEWAERGFADTPVEVADLLGDLG
jgi:AcrR family transcriptional regulator